jgi:hypothetical protein
MLAEDGIVGEVVGVTERIDALAPVSGPANATLTLESVDFEAGTTEVTVGRRVGDAIRSRLTLSMGLPGDDAVDVPRLGRTVGKPVALDASFKRNFGLSSDDTAATRWFAAAVSVAEAAFEQEDVHLETPVTFELVQVPEASNSLTTYRIPDQEAFVVVDDRAQPVLLCR